MRNTKSVAFPHFTHTYTDAYIQSCTHSSRKTKAAQSCFSPGLRDGWREKGKREREKKKRERASSCWWGSDRAAPAPHRRITLERTHHLCSFVELSHFNPPAEPIGNRLYTLSTRHGAPRPSPPHPTQRHPTAALPPSAFPPLCCCRLASGTNTLTKATPTTGLPHVCQEHQVGRREEKGGFTL